MSGKVLEYMVEGGKNKAEYSKFKKMVEEEYLHPIKELLEKVDYSENGDETLYKADEILKEINRINISKIHSASYTLEEEIKHMDSDNKFKYIRMFNYVLDLQVYLATLGKLYTYHPIQGGMTEGVRKEYKFKKDKLKYWNENIDEKFKQYVKVEINSLGGTSLEEEFDDYIGGNK